VAEDREDDVDGQERPRPLSAAGHLLAFRAGKKDRVLVRRNGTTITVEALVKRNDHRWYGSEAGPRGEMIHETIRAVPTRARRMLGPAHGEAGGDETSGGYDVKRL